MSCDTVSPPQPENPRAASALLQVDLIMAEPLRPVRSTKMAISSISLQAGTLAAKEHPARITFALEDLLRTCLAHVF
jgi:hypothetical protein